MKALLIGTILATVALTGCGKPTYNEIGRPVYEEREMTRSEYCRSIGLYKEIDSNDCETYADAYDLDEGNDYATNEMTKAEKKRVIERKKLKAERKKIAAERKKLKKEKKRLKKEAKKVKKQAKKQAKSKSSKSKK